MSPIAFLHSIPLTPFRSLAHSTTPTWRAFQASSSFVSSWSRRAGVLLTVPLSLPHHPRSLCTMSYSTQELQQVKFPTSVEYAGTILETYGVSRLDLLSALLSHSDGARGFFVSLLTSPEAATSGVVSDRDFIRVLLGAGEGREGHPRSIRELIVKNVVMPTAMAMTHDANGDVEKADASKLTRDNAAALLAACLKCEREEQGSWSNNSVSVADVAAEMLDGLRNGSGKYTSFLVKWGYSDVQKEEMAKILELANL